MRAGHDLAVFDKHDLQILQRRTDGDGTVSASLGCRSIKVLTVAQHNLLFEGLRDSGLSGAPAFRFVRLNVQGHGSRQ